MMTSAEIRQSFLDFFQSKQHTLVPSASLLPDSPNLLFTNAGMNQFVPIFLGERQPDVDRWPGAVTGKGTVATRAADTQKCIRAGGKHNDLEDVGLDTYHHTFFEMLGNWSFGDYFKREAIEWAWELLTKVWGFPKERLYATVYQPGEGDPAEFDQEAWDIWADILKAEGLDPEVHIVRGGRKDNFWMMGETGPCGPCSEVHIDLTPAGDTGGRLVNADSAQCIEIWNLVFIQFNANPDGTFSPLPARHVDTGMGFERVAGIMQNTAGFTRFDQVVSNYESDVFRPLFERLETLSGKRYRSTLPGGVPAGGSGEQVAVDVAFRVIADHIRTLSFAIADGILPGNTDRNYVLRRILRRAVRYGRTLGFHDTFLHLLVDTLVESMGEVFPELRSRQAEVKATIRQEEEAFNRTLDGGLRIFQDTLRIKQGMERVVDTMAKRFDLATAIEQNPDLGLDDEAVCALYDAAKLLLDFGQTIDRQLYSRILAASEESRLITAYAQAAVEGIDRLRASGEALPRVAEVRDKIATFRRAFEEFMRQTEAMRGVLGGAPAFLLYDTYGFPLDLTELLARERGLTVDAAGFDRLMEEQKSRARAAQKKTVIELSQIETGAATEFVGFDKLETPARVLEVVGFKDQTAVILDTTACYAEMGGQVGDTGELIAAADWCPPTGTEGDGETDGGTAGATANASSPLRGMTGAGSPLRIANTQKTGDTWLHFVDGDDLPGVGDEVLLRVDTARREAIQRHHTVTHLLHWALHEVVSREAAQKGSFVGPDKLTFDFNSTPLTPGQIADIEKLVNEQILANAGVSWTEVQYDHIRQREDIMQFFGEKYGEWVRVVQVGGEPKALNGYSMELCGGTHTRATGEIGLFRIVGESAIAAGIRRIEAVAGLEAYRHASEEMALIRNLAERVNSPVGELEKKVEALLAHQKELEKQLKAMQQQQAAAKARDLLNQARDIGGIPAIIARLDADGNTLQSVVNDLKGQFPGVILLGGATDGGSVALVAAVGKEHTKRVQAGRLIQQVAPIVGGKGGGKPESARGGGKDPSKLDAALAKAAELLA
jgi:alanyl-tRNA synthetase